MGLSDGLKELIVPLWEGYRNARLAGGMTPATVKDFNHNFISTLEARLTALSYQGKEEDQEFRECRFLVGAVESGWTLGDMEFFSTLYEKIDSADPRDEKGLALLARLQTQKISTLAQRSQMLNDIGNHITFLIGQNPENRNLIDQLNSVLNAPLNYGEYPEDKEFENNLRKEGTFSSNVVVEKGKRLDVRKGLFLEAGYRRKRSEQERRKQRELGTYVMSEMTDQELEEVDFNLAQRERKLQKSNRQALKEVFGEEVYDQIDEMHKGSQQERTIKIHHARGTQLQQEGHPVLEFELAGTGYIMPRREHQGQHGKEETKEVTQEEIRKSLKETYGDVVEDKTGKIYTGIRCKSSDRKLKNGTVVNKTKFNIEGPNNVNIGDYSIENTRVYVKNLTREYLSELFQKWENKEEKPHDVYVLISGHSRGGVSAGESTCLIEKWLNDYVKENKKRNPECVNYVSHIKKELLQRDAVPGAGTNVRLGKLDLRQVKNLNATVFCSMAQEHTDFVFPLQKVRGANRIIITTSTHSMDLANMDLSQKTRAEDGLAHQSGLYDAETGEYYRRSGISQMPDGVYIADDRFNTIRITSYSQLGKVIDTVYGDTPKQKGRVETIHKMVRDWFYDNTLTISYRSEGEYEKAKDKALLQMDQIMAEPIPRLKPIQAEIKKLDALLLSDAPKEQIAKQNKKLIEACREYIKKTAIPAEGHRAEKMNMVCDLLTFAQRENNYFERGLDPSPFQEKKGQAERQLEREQKRLRNEKEIKNYIANTKKYFTNFFNQYKATISGAKRAPYIYDFYKTLEKASTIGPDMPVPELMQTIQQLGSYCDLVKRANQSSNSKGVITTTLYAGRLLENVNAIYKDLGKKLQYFGDTDLTINERITERNARIDHLQHVIENGGKKPDEAQQAKERIEEAIRHEQRRFNALKRQAKDNKDPLLGRNRIELSAAKLVFLETIRDAENAAGYQNAKAVMAKLADHRLLEIAAGPIAESPGFKEMVKKTPAENLKEKYDALSRRPGPAKSGRQM